MPLFSLWIPVVLSALAMFVMGAIAWMVLPHHKRLWKGFPDEEAARRVIGQLPPGQYRIPFSSDPNAMKDPAFLAKYASGPVGTLQLEQSGPMKFGMRLGLTFAWNLLVAFMVGYVLRHSGLGEEAAFMDVMQLAGASCFGFCALALFPDVVWFSKSCSRLRNELLDAVAYALVTGAIFAAFWPD